MMNAPWTQMKQLQGALATEVLGIKAELTTFPSGSAMLDVRHRGRAFVLAYTPRDGFGVDELYSDDGFVAGYRYVFEDFEPAARQLRTLATARPSTPTLSLLVVQSADVEAAKDFYSDLGLSFVEEKHGKGPVHWSATAGALVLEIYPCQVGNSPPPMWIGFRVPSFDQTLEKVRQQGRRIVREAIDSPWGRRAVVEDPDGNRVELSDTDARPVQ